jgi:quercetin dioxygenase-like cupin family protein
MSTQAVKQNEFIENSTLEWQDVTDKIQRKIMAYDGSLMLVKVKFEAGGVGSLHHHFHSQITHIESGSFEVEIGPDKKVLSAGDAYYIPPNVVHGAVCLEPGILIDVFSPMREDFV